MKNHLSPQLHIHNDPLNTSWDVLLHRAQSAYQKPSPEEIDDLIQRVTDHVQERNTVQRNPSVPSPWFQWLRNGMIGVGALAALFLVILGGSVTQDSSSSQPDTFEKTIAYETLQEETSFEHELMTQEDDLVSQEIDTWLSGLVDQTVSS